MPCLPPTVATITPETGPRGGRTELRGVGYDQGRDALSPTNGGYDAQTAARSPHRNPGPSSGPAANTSPAPSGPAAGTQVNSVPTGYQSGATLRAMTMGELYEFTRTQVDWADGPQVTGADRQALWPIVRFLYERENHRAACTSIPVAQLIAHGDHTAAFRALSRYSGAFEPQARPTVPLQSVATSLATAMLWADHIDKMFFAIPGPVQAQIFEQADFEAMVSANATDAFADYVSACDPLLHADGGHEIRSFLAGRREGIQFINLPGTLGHVRNYHRFTKNALEGFATGWADTSKSKPLTLVVHSAVDHNGAFHRDPFLDEVATKANVNAVLVEGPRNLGEAGTFVNEIAASHGQNGQIDQVMIAGHGNARSMELTADARVDGDALRIDEQGIVAGDPATQAFFQAITSNMDPSSPHHRIVLNACLTNSIDLTGFTPTLTVPDGSGGMRPTTDAERRQEAAAFVAANPSLADQLSAMAPTLDIRGANASIGQVDLMDSSGALHIQSADDPQVMASKETYIKQGTEPSGAIRAVMAVYMADPARAHAAMRHRLRVPQGPWIEPMIALLYRIILRDHPDDLAMMQQLDGAAYALGDGWFEAECRVAMYGQIPAQHRVEILNAYLTQIGWNNEPWVPLVCHQILQAHSAPGSLNRLLAAAGHSSFGCAEIRDFIDFSVLTPLLPGLLGASATGQRARGQKTLALLAVIDNAGSAAAVSYLTTLCRANGNRLPADCRRLIQGASTEDEILVAIGLRPGGTTPTGPVTVDANADTDGDGTNDVYIESTSDRMFIVLFDGRELMCEPRAGSQVHGPAPRDEAYDIYGKVGDYYAVEDGQHIVYLHDDAGLAL